MGETEDDGIRRVPKQARAQERLSRILDAARTELENRPIGDIRTDDIAERAGVPVGSIYHYFESKTTLLVAVAEMVVAEADAAVTSHLSTVMELPWEEAVDRLFEATFTFYRGSQSYRFVLASLRYTPEFARVTMESNERMANMMALHPAFVRAGIGRDRASDICHVAITAGNAVQDRILSDDSLDFDFWLEEMRQMIKNYLAGHLP